MKIILLNKEKILIKNNYLYLKNKYFCNIKIPINLTIYCNKNNIMIISNYFDKKMENSFFKIINNLLIGINILWQIEIFISGIGYKIYLEKNKIFLNLGFSKPKFVLIPYFIKIDLRKEKIILKSSFKDRLGSFSFKILKSKKFDPYKKKGLYLEKKIVLKKSSKKKQ
ncbi:MAG: hypothetical protein NVS86_00935 [Candidatus Carsonella ruddii]|nr:MAG: hypothetical protein NVS86_00935 [Candidatus Carsonella ruddii]